MQYQLVLQFSGDSLGDYDAMLALEDDLIQEFGHADVDGHDIGSGETNIFLVTSEPDIAIPSRKGSPRTLAVARCGSSSLSSSRWANLHGAVASSPARVLGRMTRVRPNQSFEADGYAAAQFQR